MLPLATFSLKHEYRLNGYDEFDVADRLRQRGWVVPAYTMAPDAQVTYPGIYLSTTSVGVWGVRAQGLL